MMLNQGCGNLLGADAVFCVGLEIGLQEWVVDVREERATEKAARGTLGVKPCKVVLGGGE